MKNYQIAFIPSAMDDLNAAKDWYAEQSEHQEKRFEDSFLRSIALLNINPFLYAVRRKSVRRAPLKNFPFGIYYLVEEAAMNIVILAVCHNSRNPKIWEDRA